MINRGLRPLFQKYSINNVRRLIFDEVAYHFYLVLFYMNAIHYKVRDDKQNAVRQGLGMPLLILPRATAVGDLIAYANEKAISREVRKLRFTFAGSEYFKRMKEMKLYTTDVEAINKRINQLNLNDIFNVPLL